MIQENKCFATGKSIGYSSMNRSKIMKNKNNNRLSSHFTVTSEQAATINTLGETSPKEPTIQDTVMEIGKMACDVKSLAGVLHSKLGAQSLPCAPDQSVSAERKPDLFTNLAEVFHTLWSAKGLLEAANYKLGDM
jgi:hypothetical protein